ncbi:unnamed protein product [Psylliodes chrysocephalus]|uniref:Uncharacterized protein n=1 Tax=Psylliodes chrysocephalus TaxID=3402493 RepID=A0A9P0CRJ0_9CUCU|nr:unnamed protein product [Psylliodes chrysocephala]
MFEKMKCVSCVICKQKDARKVNPFTKSTLNKCKITLKIRQENNLKYCDVILPSEVSFKEGYHRQCYANFTSLKKQYKQNLSTISLESPPTSDILSRSYQVFENIEVVQTTPELEDSVLFPDNPPTSYQVVESIEDVQMTPEYEDSVLFLDNLSRSDESFENIEIVKTEPQLEESVNYINNQDHQPEVQDSPGPTPEPATADLYALSENTNVCIFCTRARRKVKGKHIPLFSLEKDALINTLQPYKEFLENTTVYKTLQSSVDVKAHRNCRVEYINSLRMYNNKPKTEYHKKLEYRDKAFQEVCFFIDENIVKDKKCFFFSFLCQYYTETVKKLAAENGEEIDSNVGAAFFQQKLRKKYGDLLDFTLMHHKKIVGPKGRQIDEYLYSLIQEKNIV